MSRAAEPHVARKAAAGQRGMARTRASWGGRLGTVLPPLVTLALILALWQALIIAFDLKPYLVPSPWAVLQALWVYRDDLWSALLATLKDAVIGLTISVVAGLLIAILITRHTLLERGLLPYATALQTIPVISFAPLILIWMGTGDPGVILIALIVAIFPIISNTTMGLLSTDHNLINLATIYNASGWQQLVKLRLPSALPYILAGVRISSGLCVIGVIVGEWYAGTGGDSGGLGFIISVTARTNVMDELFAATLLTSALGIVVFVVVSIVSHLWLRRWHESSLAREN